MKTIILFHLTLSFSSSPYLNLQIINQDVKEKKYLRVKVVTNKDYFQIS